jgi:hypothetical protein
MLSGHLKLTRLRNTNEFENHLICRPSKKGLRQSRQDLTSPESETEAMWFLADVYQPAVWCLRAQVSYIQTDTGEGERKKGGKREQKIRHMKLPQIGAELPALLTLRLAFKVGGEHHALFVLFPPGPPCLVVEELIGRETIEEVSERSQILQHLEGMETRLGRLEAQSVLRESDRRR